MHPPPFPPEKQLTLADRSRYAKQIFYTNTNVRDVAREEVLVRYPNHAQKDRLIARCCRLLYKKYANEPKTRLMSPLHKIQFVSRYYEYRFKLALRKSFATEEEYQRYMDVALAGGAKECFVDTTQNNVLLQDQGRLMAKLQREFSNWSSKVENLPKYLMAVQRKRRANKANAEKSKEDPELLDALLRHSNTTLPEMRIRSMFRHLQVGEDSAGDITWMFGRKIQFDSDELNRRFRVGPYLTEPADENAKEDGTERYTLEAANENLEASDGLQMATQITVESLPETQNFWPENNSTQINLVSLTGTTRPEYVDEPTEQRLDTPVPIPRPPNVVASLNSSTNSIGYVSDSTKATTVLQISNVLDCDISNWEGSVEEVPFVPVVIDSTEDCTLPGELLN